MLLRAEKHPRQTGRLPRTVVHHVQHEIRDILNAEAIPLQRNSIQPKRVVMGI